MALLRTPSGRAAGRSIGAAAVSTDFRPKPEPVSASPAPAALMRCRRVNMVVLLVGRFFSWQGPFMEYFMSNRRNLKRSSLIIDRGNFDTPGDGVAAVRPGCCYGS